MVDAKSPSHSLTAKEAKEKRTLALSDYVNQLRARRAPGISPVHSYSYARVKNGKQCSHRQEETFPMKRTMAFTSSVATLVFSGTTLLCPQQPAQSAPPPMNVTEEQVNDANIQLMPQDIRSQRQKVVAANMPLTDTEATKFWPVYDRYIGETI